MKIGMKRFVSDEKEEVVMGEWKECKLGDVVVFNYGKSLKTEHRILGNVPVFSSAGLSGWHNQALANSLGIIVGRKGTIVRVYNGKRKTAAA